MDCLVSPARSVTKTINNKITWLCSQVTSQWRQQTGSLLRSQEVRERSKTTLPTGTTWCCGGTGWMRMASWRWRASSTWGGQFTDDFRNARCWSIMWLIDLKSVFSAQSDQLLLNNSSSPPPSSSPQHVVGASELQDKCLKLQEIVDKMVKLQKTLFTLSFRDKNKTLVQNPIDNQ